MISGPPGTIVIAIQGGAANSIVMSPNGNIVVGIQNTGVNSQPEMTAAVFTNAGLPAVSFNGNGIVSIQPMFASSCAGAFATAGNQVVLYGAGSSDGATYTNYLLVRYSAAGVKDTEGFGTAGVVTSPNLNSCVAQCGVQDATGNMYVGGYAATADQSVFFIAAGKFLAANGELDTTYNSGGPTPGFAQTVVGSGGFSFALSLQIQSDSKLVSVGQYTNDDVNFPGCVVRYSTAGVLDAGTYNAGGTQPGVVLETFVLDHGAMALSPTDELFASGSTPVSGPCTSLLLKLTAAGAPDAVWAGSGRITTSATFSSEPTPLCFQLTDGSVMIVNSHTSFVTYCRFNADSSVYPGYNVASPFSFQVGGGNLTAYNGCQQGNRLLLCGYAQAPGNIQYPWIAAINLLTGLLDSTFPGSPPPVPSPIPPALPVNPPRQMRLDLSADYLCWDNTEAITIEQATAGGRRTYSISVAKGRAITSQQKSPTRGVYLGFEQRWHVPARLVPAGVMIKPRDVVIGEDGRRRTVLVAGLERLKQRWQLDTIDLVLAHDLIDTVSIERAAITYDDSGAAKKTFPPGSGTILYQLAARVQHVSEEIAEERGLRYDQRRYDVYVGEQIEGVNVAEDRVTWMDPQGVFWHLEITGIRNPEQIEELPVLECVRRL